MPLFIDTVLHQEMAPFYDVVEKLFDWLIRGFLYYRSRWPENLVAEYVLGNLANTAFVHISSDRVKKVQRIGCHEVSFLLSPPLYRSERALKQYQDAVPI
jgi:hypothetical protein